MQAKSKRSVIILGCTGSIGTTALQALAPLQDQFTIVGLSAHSSIDTLATLAQQWDCHSVCISGDDVPVPDSQLFTTATQLFTGAAGLLAMIRETEADIVLNAIAGASGLAPTLAAIESHKDVALANKESIVMAGSLLFSLARENGVTIIPVDSEHSTLHALLQAHGRSQTASLVITASGGPFRTFPIERMAEITVEMALAHPTWQMGAKISIDSATLANKGLEVIEAAYLFDFPSSAIEVVIHPQSVVHSLIRLYNGALYAQLSPPDMALPIMAALGDGYIDLEAVVAPLDFTDLSLTFEKPDLQKFPLLASAFTCSNLQGGYPIAFNAANEVAVHAFLQHKLSFLDVATVVQETLTHDWSQAYHAYEEIIEIDGRARAFAQHIRKGLS